MGPAEKMPTSDPPCVSELLGAVALLIVSISYNLSPATATGQILVHNVILSNHTRVEFREVDTLHFIINDHKVLVASTLWKCSTICVVENGARQSIVKKVISKT